METISSIPGKLLYFTHELQRNKKVSTRETAILKGKSLAI